VDWTHLGQDREKWWAVLNTAMTLAYHKMRGISRKGEGPLVLQEMLHRNEGRKKNDSHSLIQFSIPFEIKVYI